MSVFQLSLPGGLIVRSDGYTMYEDPAMGMQSRAATPEEMAALNNYARQPSTIAGNAERDRQHKAGSGRLFSDLLDKVDVGEIIKGATLAMMTGGALGAFDGGASGFVGDLPLAGEAGSIYSAPAAGGGTAFTAPGINSEGMSLNEFGEWAPNVNSTSATTFLPDGTRLPYDITNQINRAPVDDRSKTFDPSTSGGLPNLGNLAASAVKGGGASASTAGAAGEAAGGLSTIKNSLSLTSAVGNLLQGLNLPSVGETGSTLARASEGARRRVTGQNIDQINSAFSGFDDRYYDSIADAFKNYYQPQVTRQFDDASRNIIYAAPGGVGSSTFASKLSEAERERQQAGTDVAANAQNEAMAAKTGIEGQKANLLGLAESSEDPAALGAQAVAGAQASSYVPKYSAIGDLVSRYASLASAAGALENQGYGRQSVRPINFGAGGGRSSVRNIG